jgi:hypothetical protein
LSNGNQAVVCNDINKAATAGGFELWGTGEYFCQGPSVQCKGIHASNSLITSFGDAQSPAFSCSTTACPNGGRAMVSTAHVFVPAGFCVVAVATIPAGDAILVNGTSTAFHPAADFTVENDNICA